MLISFFCGKNISMITLPSANEGRISDAWVTQVEEEKISDGYVRHSHLEVFANSGAI